MRGPGATGGGRGPRARRPVRARARGCVRRSGPRSRSRGHRTHGCCGSRRGRGPPGPAARGPAAGAGAHRARERRAGPPRSARRAGPARGPGRPAGRSRRPGRSASAEGRRPRECARRGRGRCTRPGRGCPAAPPCLRSPAVPRPGSGRCQSCVPLAHRQCSFGPSPGTPNHGTPVLVIKNERARRAARNARGASYSRGRSLPRQAVLSRLTVDCATLRVPRVVPYHSADQNGPLFRTLTNEATNGRVRYNNPPAYLPHRAERVRGRGRNAPRRAGTRRTSRARSTPRCPGRRTGAASTRRCSRCR